MSNDNIEVWKDVVYFRNYEVSNLGNVRRKDNLKPVVPIFDDTETPTIGLYHMGQKKRRSLPVVVANAFLGVPDPQVRHVVSHKDGNKKNNNIDNLVWITEAEYRSPIFRRNKVWLQSPCYIKLATATKQQ